jgi:hypothetical protein
VLYNGLGRYQDAYAAARQACGHEDLGLFGWCLVEIIEGAASSGECQPALQAPHQLEERALSSGTDWAVGILARSQALLADDRVAESAYREAIERLECTRITVHLARTHLLDGEWLRRCNHRELLATAQKAQIARPAGAGLTNPETAAQLFISTRRMAPEKGVHEAPHQLAQTTPGTRLRTSRGLMYPSRLPGNPEQVDEYAAR